MNPPVSPRRATGARDPDDQVIDGEDSEPLPDWVTICEKSTRGFYMNITNETTERLYIMDAQLSSGRWCVPLPEFIEPETVLHVGCVSSGACV